MSVRNVNKYTHRPYHNPRARLDAHDFFLARKAMRQRWKIPRELYKTLIEQASKILDEPDASRKDRLAAMKFVLMADELNLKHEALQLDRDLLAEHKALKAKFDALSAGERLPVDAAVVREPPPLEDRR